MAKISVEIPPVESAIIPDSYFQGHECHLPTEKLSEFRILYSKWRKWLLDLTTVRSDDVRARIIFMSYAALCAEKYRQYAHYPLSIHPYSRLRLWMEIVFVFAMIISYTMLPIHFSETVPEVTNDLPEHIMFITDMLMIINILSNFFTGYVQGNTDQHVVLDLKKIFCKYIRAWFIVDLVTAVSFVPDMLRLTSITPFIILTSLKILRLPTLYVYISNIMQAYKVERLTRTCIELFVCAYLYLIWNMYFQFVSEYMIEHSYDPQNPRNCSWITTGNLWNETLTVRFVYALERAVSMLRTNANLSRIGNERCYETFYTVAWLIAKILVYHCGLKYVIAAYGSESAAAKYYIMTRQIEMYINQRKLPPRIKKKILKFYTIRYQAIFFEEPHMLACVSGQLREDIIMHTGRQLVRELEFLKQTPRTLLLQIGSKLQLVIFIAGDIIYKINTVGDCLYFVDKGTVAIYTESGKEVCHLEDGDFFGEIALVMKHRFRTVSAVAVTNCELFRLNREEFNRSIACYPTVYEHIKKVATQRYERTFVLDENHKTEMKKAQ